MTRSPEAEDIDAERLFRPWLNAEALVLAVSGGPDSTALMHLAADWRRASRPRLYIACVDHGLRSGSDREAEGVCRRAEQLGFPAAVLRWDGPKPVRAIQERARTARYNLLLAHARIRGASHIVTAHTLDDQAETLLFRMARGSGPAGLAGMAASVMRDGIGHFRPFLPVRKSRLVALCQREGWAYVDDPSNGDTCFARVRWRSLTPILEREGLSAERLGALAERAARAEQALQAYASVIWQEVASVEGTGHRIAMGRLAASPAEIVLRVIRRALVDITKRDDLRLDKLERLTADLLRSHVGGQAMRRTLHLCLVSLDPAGNLLIKPEAPRRAERADATVHLDESSRACPELPAPVPLAITIAHHTLRK